MSGDADREANLEVVRRFYEEFTNDHRYDVAEQVLAPEVTFRTSMGTQVNGRDELVAFLKRLHESFPDFSHRIDELFAAEDRVFSRVTNTGTHEGTFRDMEPTGARIEYVGATWFRLRDGRIVEGWTVGDTAELWRALGKL